MQLDKFVEIWLNCCIAIILLNVFFIVLTQWQLHSTAGCTALMLLFHLFLLAAFVWINIEIFSNYHLVADLFTYEHYFMLKRILIGCGNLICILRFIQLFYDCLFHVSLYLRAGRDLGWVLGGPGTGLPPIQCLPPNPLSDHGSFLGLKFSRNCKLFQL